MICNVLTIAGTDPSGGAGISADLKTFSALGAYGTVVITAVIAQNTRRVDAVHQLPGGIVSQQLQTLFATSASTPSRSACSATQTWCARSPARWTGTARPTSCSTR